MTTRQTYSVNRIFLRVFTILGILLFSLSLIYTLLVIPLQKKALESIMESRAATVSRSIVLATSDAMATGDFGAIVDHNLQVIENDATILRVVISTIKHQPLVIEDAGWRMLNSLDSLYLRMQGSKPTTRLSLGEGAPGAYHYTYPISFYGIDWGWIHIIFATDEYEHNISEMYSQIISISLIALLLMLFVGYFTARWITNPITAISHGARRVAEGDLDALLDIRRNDEIGELSENFNKMVHALRKNKSALEQVNQELEEKVRIRTKELNLLNQTLDQRVKTEIAKRREQEHLLIQQSRLAAMGEMIGNIAHQWRQPLNALSLVIERVGIKFEQRKLDQKSMDASLDKAADLIQNMSETIDDFRNFFKPVKTPETFKIDEAICSALSLLDAAFSTHSIGTRFDFKDASTVSSYKNEFSQVMLNLLSNCRDAFVERKTADPVITISASEPDAHTVRITVEDNAGGIDADILPKIFEPYFTTKHKSTGTGIGLYMSKTIIENNMQGRLEAQNAESGARFTITIPKTLTPE